MADFRWVSPSISYENIIERTCEDYRERPAVYAEAVGNYLDVKKFSAGKIAQPKAGKKPKKTVSEAEE